MPNGGLRVCVSMGVSRKKKWKKQGKGIKKGHYLLLVPMTLRL